MSTTRSALDADWLGVCRRAVTGLERLLAAAPTTVERAVETGTRGSGGDRTLVIDQLRRERRARAARGPPGRGLPLRRAVGGARRGRLRRRQRPGDHRPDRRLAERQAPDLPLRAVGGGGRRRDDGRRGVRLRARLRAPRAVVGAARRGAWRDGTRLDPSLPERRSRDGRLEVLGIESADPRWVAASIDALVESTHRLRALGTIASSLCQVAAARFDGMVSLRRCRGVDAAAGQLIVREAGGLVSFPDCDEPLGAPLDAAPSSPVVAARTLQTLRELERVVA